MLVLSVTLNAQTNKRVFKTFELNGKKIDYAVQVPADFDAKKTYPIMIGPSEVESDDDQSFYWRGVSDTEGWILIDFPIFQKEGVKEFLSYLRTIYRVEGNKFHTVCFSANSSGIFDLVMRMPDNFHSITGMAGNPGTRDKKKLAALKEVKVQFVVGDRDTYWMNAAKDRHKLLLELGVDSSIEIIKNGKHVLTELIGTGFLMRANKLREK